MVPARTTRRHSITWRSIKAVDEDADSVDGVTADSARLHLRALEVLNEQGKDERFGLVAAPLESCHRRLRLAVLRFPSGGGRGLR